MESSGEGTSGTSEFWMDIPGYVGFYQVSNLGRVKSLSRKVADRRGFRRKIPERILSPCLDDGGYPMVHLCRDGVSSTYRMHRLVAEAFIPNGENLPEVNHKDGNKSNNRVENLEWVTTRDNVIHAIRMGLSSMEPLKRYAKSHRKSVVCLDTGKIFASTTEASNVLDLNVGSISQVCRNLRGHAGGYHFAYRMGEECGDGD